MKILARFLAVTVSAILLHWGTDFKVYADDESQFLHLRRTKFEDSTSLNTTRHIANTDNSHKNDAANILSYYPKLRFKKLRSTRKFKSVDENRINEQHYKIPFSFERNRLRKRRSLGINISNTSLPPETAPNVSTFDGDIKSSSIHSDLTLSETKVKPSRQKRFFNIFNSGIFGGGRSDNITEDANSTSLTINTPISDSSCTENCEFESPINVDVMNDTCNCRSLTAECVQTCFGSSKLNIPENCEKCFPEMAESKSTTKVVNNVSSSNCTLICEFAMNMQTDNSDDCFNCTKAIFSSHCDDCNWENVQTTTKVIQETNLFNDFGSGDSSFDNHNLEPDEELAEFCFEQFMAQNLEFSSDIFNFSTETASNSKSFTVLNGSVNHEKHQTLGLLRNLLIDMSDDFANSNVDLDIREVNANGRKNRVKRVVNIWNLFNFGSGNSARSVDDSKFDFADKPILDSALNVKVDSVDDPKVDSVDDPKVDSIDNPKIDSVDNQKLDFNKNSENSAAYSNEECIEFFQNIISTENLKTKPNLLDMLAFPKTLELQNKHTMHNLTTSVSNEDHQTLPVPPKHFQFRTMHNLTTSATNEGIPTEPSNDIATSDGYQMSPKHLQFYTMHDIATSASNEVTPTESSNDITTSAFTKIEILPTMKYENTISESSPRFFNVIFGSGDNSNSFSSVTKSETETGNFTCAKLLQKARFFYGFFGSGEEDSNFSEMTMNDLVNILRQRLGNDFDRSEVRLTDGKSFPCESKQLHTSDKNSLNISVNDVNIDLKDNLNSQHNPCESQERFFIGSGDSNDNDFSNHPCNKARYFFETIFGSGDGHVMNEDIQTASDPCDINSRLFFGNMFGSGDTSEEFTSDVDRTYLQDIYLRRFFDFFGSGGGSEESYNEDICRSLEKYFQEPDEGDYEIDEMSLDVSTPEIADEVSGNFIQNNESTNSQSPLYYLSNSRTEDCIDDCLDIEMEETLEDETDCSNTSCSDFSEYSDWTTFETNKTAKNGSAETKQRQIILTEYDADNEKERSKCDSDCMDDFKNYDCSDEPCFGKTSDADISEFQSSNECDTGCFDSPVNVTTLDDRNKVSDNECTDDCVSEYEQIRNVTTDVNTSNVETNLGYPESECQHDCLEKSNKNLAKIENKSSTEKTDVLIPAGNKSIKYCTHSSQCSSFRNERCVNGGDNSICDCGVGFVRHPVSKNCETKLTMSATLRFPEEEFDEELENVRSEKFKRKKTEAEYALWLLLGKNTVMISQVTDVEVIKFGPGSLVVHWKVILASPSNESVYDVSKQLNTTFQEAFTDTEILRKMPFKANRGSLQSSALTMNPCDNKDLNYCSRDAICLKDLNRPGGFFCQCYKDYEDFSDHQEDFPGEVCQAICPTDYCGIHGHCRVDKNNELECLCSGWHFGHKCQISGIMVVTLVAIVNILIVFFTVWCICYIRKRRARQHYGQRRNIWGTQNFDSRQAANTLALHDTVINSGCKSNFRPLETTPRGESMTPLNLPEICIISASDSEIRSWSSFNTTPSEASVLNRSCEL